MANGCRAMAAGQLARLFQHGILSADSDRDLLTGFVERGDEAAFEALLRRHGPLVLNVCRKRLSDTHDLEDAFQATFLVLARNARSLRVGESLAPWLSTVAYRVASRVRAGRNRLRSGELSDQPSVEPSARKVLDQHDLAELVQEEICRLPARFRDVVRCCYLEGMTHEQAAERLGWPVGTVRSRLARARTRLQPRLARRGVTLSLAALGALLSPWSVTAAITPTLHRSTLELALRSLSRRAEAIGASASVLSLMEGVLIAMRIKKIAIVVPGLISAVAVLCVTAAIAFQQPVSGPERSEATRSNTRQDSEQRKDSEKAPNRRSTVARTYYVGDLINAGRKTDHPDRPTVDMGPLMDLISSVVAPGTWRTLNSSGEAIASRTGLDESAGQSVSEPKEPIGTMTPFFLSISLIIRHEPEVHKQISVLLKKLRNLMFLEKRRETENVSTRIEESSVARTRGRDPLAQKASVTDSPKKTRIRELLKQLEREIEATEPNQER